ncbi:IS66 family insertion sequence element accessory protein TnpA [Acetobacterium tundrae]|uniref:Transposase n=1 Tax=Acetobacterium tundrae TaxID=132932 RepID=A0ABR6WQF3_9FIRM|nr:hypothetical protein [Acetobacterium tundrae]MBC3798676.1 hypothetical protein [Acetobacterium tundrae]
MDESKRILWEDRFQEQASSGMTVEAWCSKNQIAKHTFYYWKQRIRKAKMEPVEKDTETSLFAKLEMPPASGERRTEAGLTIKWQGFELILSNPNDISLATQFIRQFSQS